MHTHEPHNNYVPININKLAHDIFADQKYKSAYTKYHAHKTIIDSLLQKYHITGETKYPQLYPGYAIQILILSRTTKWPPNIDVDGYLEKSLTEWLKNNISNPVQYVENLLQTIDTEKCLSGTLLRLNLDVIAQPTIETVTINTTKQKPIAITKQLRRDVFTGKLRQKITHLLQEQSAYTNNLDTIYADLKHIHGSYSLEQALLGWMGYIILKTIAESSKGNLKLQSGTLLIEQRT